MMREGVMRPVTVTAIIAAAVFLATWEGSGEGGGNVNTGVVLEATKLSSKDRHVS